MQHQKALQNIGTEFSVEQREKASWQKYDPDLMRFCEIGVKIIEEGHYEPNGTVKMNCIASKDTRQDQRQK